MARTCPTCNGSRKIRRDIRRAWWQVLLSHPATVDELCPDCAGVGVIQGSPEEEQELSLKRQRHQEARAREVAEKKAQRQGGASPKAPATGRRMSPGDALGEALVQMRTECRCGASITFEEGVRLARASDIPDNVVMCGRCHRVFKVDLGPRGFSLREDVTDQYYAGSQLRPEAQLKAAFSNRDLAKLKQLIREGTPWPSLSSYDSSGACLLELACSKDDVELAELLVAKGVEINKRRVSDEKLPIDTAVRHGQVRMVEFLLDRGAPVPSLREAADRGKLELVRLLVTRGESISQDALVAAARSGHRNVVSYLIEKGGVVSERAITCAREKGFTDISALLEASFQEDPRAHLVAAAQSGDLARVKQIIGDGCPLWFPMENYFSAMVPLWRLAGRTKDVELADLLLAKGGDTDPRGDHAPIAAIAAAGDQSTVELMLERGARLLDETLCHAVYSGKLQLVQYLVSKGAHVNRRTAPRQWTPLETAADKRELEIVRCLLEHGAKVSDQAILNARKDKYLGRDVVAMLEEYAKRGGVVPQSAAEGADN